MAGWRGRRRIDQLAGLVRYGGFCGAQRSAPAAGVGVKRKFFLWGRVYPGRRWWGRYRSLNPAPLAGIKPAPQVVPQVGPAVGRGSGRRVWRKFFLWGRGHLGRRRWGRFLRPSLGPLRGLKPAPTGRPSVVPGGGPGSGGRGDAEVLFVGPGLSRPTVVGPTRQPEPGPLAGLKAAPQAEPPVEPGGRSRLGAAGRGGNYCCEAGVLPADGGGAEKAARSY